MGYNYQLSSNSANADVFDFEHISTELFSRQAEKYAERCSKPLKKDQNKPTQLRRFYNELVMWAERSDTKERFQQNLVFIYMIKSKVAYAKGRKTIDDTYENMMNGVINGIKEGKPETLRNAKLFLEAFMGYYKKFRPKED